MTSFRKDGYTSVATRILAKAMTEDEVAAWGCETETCQVEEVQLTSTTGADFDMEAPPCTPLSKDDPPSSWKAAINEIKTKDGVKVMYSDGSRENGNTGAGWHGELRGRGMTEGSAYVGESTTVWDGEIRGVLGALRATRAEPNILILTDSQAAISAIRKAGTTRKARTQDLGEVIKE